MANKKTTAKANPKPKEKPTKKALEPRLYIERGFVDVGPPKIILGGGEVLEPPFPPHYQKWINAGWATIIEVEIEHP